MHACTRAVREAVCGVGWGGGREGRARGWGRHTARAAARRSRVRVRARACAGASSHPTRGAMECALTSKVPSLAVDPLRATLRAACGGCERAVHVHELTMRLARRRPDAPAHSVTLRRACAGAGGEGGGDGGGGMEGDQGEWECRQVGRGGRGTAAPAAAGARGSSAATLGSAAAVRAVTSGSASANAPDFFAAMGYDVVDAAVQSGFEYELPPGSGVTLLLSRRARCADARDPRTAPLTGAEPWALDAVAEAADGGEVKAAAEALEAVAAMLGDTVKLEPPQAPGAGARGAAAKRKR